MKRAIVAMALGWAAVSPPTAGAAITPTNDATRLAQAMSDDVRLGVGGQFAHGGAPSATGVSGPFGRYFPSDGPEFSVLTTGDVALANPPDDAEDAGAANGNPPRGDAKDVTVLQVKLEVPDGHNCIGFDFVFYSEEFSFAFDEAPYRNDIFLAELDRTTWSYTQDPPTLTDPDNFARGADGSAITPSSPYQDTALGTQLQYNGSTVPLRARVPATPGQHSVYFSILDAGDAELDSAVFLDNLRTAAVPPAACQSSAVPVDSDRDGLSDEWETNGVDVNGDGGIDIDLPAMGARPDHKDIFVELDAMADDRLDDAAIEVVRAAFDIAPVTNPSRRNGIKLHVDNGRDSLMNPYTGETWGDLSRANDIQRQPVFGTFTAAGYSWEAFDVVKAANFGPLRDPVFRYALSVDRFGSSRNDASGVARGLPGSDFIVALGRVGRPGCARGFHCLINTISDHGRTFMHELGHTLGLHHGGGDDLRWKPNYPSVMNYMWQFGGILRAGQVVGATDFSRFGTQEETPRDYFEPLDENALSEDQGVRATGDATRILAARHCGARLVQQVFLPNRRVNWDCDNRTGGEVVRANVNGNDGEQERKLTVLTPHEDWAKLDYASGAVGGFGLEPVLPEVTSVDEPPATVLIRAAQAHRTDRMPPRLTLRIARGARPAVRATARDNRALDRVECQVGRAGHLATPKRAGGKRANLRVVLRRGHNRVRCYARDAQGNMSKPVPRTVRV